MVRKHFWMLVFIILGAVGISTLFTTSISAAGAKSSRIKEGGSLVVSITNEPDFLDPYLATAAGTREILFNIFEGLVKPDERGNLIPAVASSYQISKDAFKYTFRLRTGIKFQNGKGVTAEDVKYSLEKAAGKNGGKPYQPALSNIKSVVVKNLESVEIHLIKADSDLLPYLTTAIIPRGYHEQNKKPIGTGPFKFVEYLPGQRLVLAKNREYWQKGLPHLDKVTFKLAANEDAAFLELKAGTIDLEPYIPVDKAEQLTVNYNVLKGNYNLVQLLALNNARKPFNDIRVRKALSYAIDTQKIIDTVTYGQGTRLGSAVFPGFKKYYQAGLEKTYRTNIARAKMLLNQAGLAKGFAMTITVPSNYKTHVDTAQVIVEQLKKINVKATIKQVEWGVWLEQVYQNRQFDATVIALDASFLSPQSLLGRYQSKDATNFINYKNPKYDGIIAQAVHTTDDVLKAKYYKQLQTILTNDAASVFIQDPGKNVLLKKNLSGYKFYPLYVQDLATIYYKK